MAEAEKNAAIRALERELEHVRQVRTGAENETARLSAEIQHLQGRVMVCRESITGLERAIAILKNM